MDNSVFEVCWVKLKFLLKAAILRGKKFKVPGDNPDDFRGLPIPGLGGVVLAQALPFNQQYIRVLMLPG